jgi:hypothetical protein
VEAFAPLLQIVAASAFFLMRGNIDGAESLIQGIDVCGRLGSEIADGS